MQIVMFTQQVFSNTMLTNFLNHNAALAKMEQAPMEHPDPSNFGEMLRELMQEKKIISRDLIEKTGINQSVLSKVLNGLRPPSKDVVETLSTFFKQDLSKWE